MYITGTKADYLSRLHQLPLSVGTGAVPIASGNAYMGQFITEGRSYISSVSSNESGRWEKEARQQFYRLSGNAAALLQQVF